MQCTNIVGFYNVKIKCIIFQNISVTVLFIYFMYPFFQLGSIHLLPHIAGNS